MQKKKTTKRQMNHAKMSTVRKNEEKVKKSLNYLRQIH
jgi:hypothetical protein